jgi:hypothetical protein
MFSRGVAEREVAKHGLDAPLSQVSSRLRAADLAAANFEGVMASDGVGMRNPGPYRFLAPPAAAGALKRAGIGLVTLANNHSLDWGPAALRDTARHLAEAGVAVVGAGPDDRESSSPRVIEAGGVKTAWLGFTSVGNRSDGDHGRAGDWRRAWADLVLLKKRIREARSLGDLVVLRIHWGVEYQRFPREEEIGLARAAIDAGADLVVGDHPHVIQGVEKYRNGFIAYSLGNFVFDQKRSAGLALQVLADKQGLREVRGISLRPGTRPVWDDPVRSAAVERGIFLTRPPRPTAFVCGRGDHGSFSIVAKTTGGMETPPWEKPRELGDIDLKGDGDKERIVLDDGRLLILEGKNEVWSSNPKWQVTDASLGDPDQDGRFEVMMLVLRRDGPEAPVTSHPYIVGCRGGEYKVLWGGSATVPWLEGLAVGDVDGDGLDELATVERGRDAVPASPGGRLVVSKWNGWGFTRRWAGEEARFVGVDIVSRKELPESRILVAWECR